MGRIINSRFASQCPYSNESQVIYIKYEEFWFAGYNGPQYKKLGYSCDKINECTFVSEDNLYQCPVYMKSPNSPR